MNKKFAFFSTFLKKTEARFLNLNLSHRQVSKGYLSYLRSKILYSLLLVGLAGGLLAYIPAFYLALTQKLWMLLVADTVAWVTLLILLFAPNLSFNLRSAVAVFLLYILGIFIIVEVGPLSGGPIWLFSAAVMAGVLLGPAAALAAVVINTAILVAMAWLSMSGTVTVDFPFFQSIPVLVAAEVNFIFLNAMVAFSVSMLLKNLEREAFEKENVQKNLEESQKRYQTLFESASDAIFILNKNFKVLDCNLKAVQMLESEKRDIIGSSPDMFSSEFKKTGWSSTRGIGQLLDTLDQKDQVLFEFKHIRKNREALNIEVSMTLVDLLSNPHIMAIVRDITQRKHLHDMMLQNEKMASIGGLAAGMAHEINNPLAGILQNIDVAMNRINEHHPSNQKAALDLGISMHQINAYFQKREIDRFLKSARMAGQKAARLVSNMLSFSYQGDREKALMEPADICELLDMTVELAQNDYDLKKNYDFRNIIIQREYETNIDKIWCEKTKIQQVFFNLLKNGAQAMADLSSDPDKSGKMTFIFRVKREKHNICIEIQDNGPGIDEITAGQIFEPFFTTKKAGTGTGLGLWVSYFIIDQHNGTINVKTSPGNGCCFKILLPVYSTRL